MILERFSFNLGDNEDKQIVGDNLTKISSLPIKCKYFPESKKELKELVNKLIEERGSEADFNDIYTGYITDMSGLFHCEWWFNGNISEWDVSNVTDMSDMFKKCEKFNQDISKWDVSKVKDMSAMFDMCKQFNGDISGWDVSNVENMRFMFAFCYKFNQDLSHWDVSKVKDMEGMFLYCKSERQHEKLPYDYLKFIGLNERFNFDMYNDREIANNTIVDFNEIHIGLNKEKLEKYGYERIPDEYSCETHYFDANSDDGINYITQHINYKKLDDAIQNCSTPYEIWHHVEKIGSNKEYGDEIVFVHKDTYEILTPKNAENFLEDNVFFRNRYLSHRYYKDFGFPITDFNGNNYIDENRQLFFKHPKIVNDHYSAPIAIKKENEFLIRASLDFGRNNLVVRNAFIDKDGNIYVQVKGDATKMLDVRDKYDSFKDFFKHIDCVVQVPNVNINDDNLKNKLKNFMSKQKVFERFSFDLDDGAEDKQIVDDDLTKMSSKYNYFPKTKEELKELVDRLIEERGNEADLNDIYTGYITDMRGLFEYRYTFNCDVSSWDVSNVVNMNSMFYKCESFNQDLSRWDVSNVKDMEYMFSYCLMFNQDIGSWDVSNVVNMNSMFWDCKMFNQDLSRWDVSSVKDITENIFFKCKALKNKPNWSRVVDESLTERFSFDLSDNDRKQCDDGGLSKISSLYKKYKYFPKTKGELKELVDKLIEERGNEADLNDIYTGYITDMSRLFEYRYKFNCDVSDWDVSNVKNMSSMFYYCENFNKDISSWDVSNVKNMCYMFSYCSSFNQDISDWDVSSVEDMDNMFWKCSDFNQDLSRWDVSNVGNIDFDNIFFRCNKLKTTPDWERFKNESLTERFSFNIDDNKQIVDDGVQSLYNIAAADDIKSVGWLYEAIFCWIKTEDCNKFMQKQISPSDVKVEPFSSSRDLSYNPSTKTIFMNRLPGYSLVMRFVTSVFENSPYCDSSGLRFIKSIDAPGILNGLEYIDRTDKVYSSHVTELFDLTKGFKKEYFDLQQAEKCDLNIIPKIVVLYDGTDYEFPTVSSFANTDVSQKYLWEIEKILGNFPKKYLNSLKKSSNFLIVFQQTFYKTKNINAEEKKYLESILGKYNIYSLDELVAKKKIRAPRIDSPVYDIVVSDSIE